jgi:DNA-binding NarL/FixJ family response regulator
LRSLLEHTLHYEVVGEASNGMMATQLAAKLKPDVVVMDVSMPDMNGMEATRRIVAKDPAIKVIALSMHSDKRFVSEMLAAGAIGYLLKDCAFEEVATAIKAVMSGKLYISPAVTGLVIKDYLLYQETGPPSDLDRLTPKEREVLQLIAEGKSVKEIGYLLELSAKTVDHHRHNIFEKLGVKSVAELVKFAIREGLTSVE